MSSAYCSPSLIPWYHFWRSSDVHWSHFTSFVYQLCSFHSCISWPFQYLWMIFWHSMSKTFFSSCLSLQNSSKMLLKCPYPYSYWAHFVQFVMLLGNIQENNSNLSKIGHEGWCFVDYIASGFRQLSFYPVLYHLNELQQSHTPRTPRWATPLFFSYHDRLPILWNCEPKQALLRFSCFCHVFCHSNKNNI